MVGSPTQPAVLFDVDGTLYDQRRLRRYMMADLLGSCLRKPGTFQEVRILKTFRKEREILGLRVAGDYERMQYELPAERLGLPAERVRAVVERWIYEKPLRFLLRCRLEGIAEWLDFLRAEGVRLGVYSEYPSAAKLDAMNLRFDVAVSSTDPDVDRFKPDPRGLVVAMQKLGVSPERTLYIGDRDDKDAPCAAAAQTSFIRIGKTYPPENLPSFLPQWKDRPTE